MIDDEDELDAHSIYCDMVVKMVNDGDFLDLVSNTLGVVQYTAGFLNPDDRRTLRALIDQAFDVLGDEIYEDDADFIHKICEVDDGLT